MATVNRAFLIGVVATPPVTRGRACEFVLGVPEERPGGARMERIRIVAGGRLAEIASTLRTAQTVYADGRLVGTRDGTFVDATTLVALGDPPAEVVPAEEPAGTHASPQPHDRAGHPRRLHAGTPDERVVWVRPTRVAEPGRHRRSRRRR